MVYALSDSLIYILTGTLVGLISGILGIGGGIITVPALLYLLALNPAIPPNAVMHFAVGTSLAIMVFTSLSAIYSHHRFGEILWSVYKRLWPGIFTGTACGAMLANAMPTDWLKVLFGVFLIAMSINLLRDRPVPSEFLSFPGKRVNALISAMIGGISGLLGIGGGTLVIAYLIHCGVHARKMAAIASLCTLTAAVAGTLVFIRSSPYLSSPVAFATGSIYWPAVFWIALPSVISAPFGAKLAYRFAVKKLRVGFVLILLITGISLLRD